MAKKKAAKKIAKKNPRTPTANMNGQPHDRK